MRHLALTFALAAVAGFAAAAPAGAQSVEQLTVTGHGPLERAQAITEVVSFADLDLTYAGDREVLLRRVNTTAGRICDRLNEPRPGPGNLGKSCQDIAVREAMGQVHEAFEDARLRYADANSSAYADANGAPASATVPDYDPR